MKFFVITLLSTFLLIVPEKGAAGVWQVATLYSELDEGGDYDVVSDDISDLKNIDFDDRTKSVCVTGVWIFYGRVNYNKVGYGDVEYRFGTNKNCTNLKAPLRGTVSSVRRSGSGEDYRHPVLTTYELPTFQGDMLDRFTIDAPAIDTEYKPESIIITGDECWTLYEKEKYDGKKICIRPPVAGSYTPSFITDMTFLQENGFDSETFSSIKKGCYCD